MSNIVKDLQIDLVISDMVANNKKQALDIIAEHMSKEIKCSKAVIYDRLMDKEQSTSSGIGGGIAIPHMRMLQMDHPITMLTKITKPIEFNAVDNKPVDIICTLISPRKDGPLHLRRLSRLSRMLANKEICTRLRETQDQNMIRSIMVSPTQWMIAA